MSKHDAAAILIEADPDLRVVLDTGPWLDYLAGAYERRFVRWPGRKPQVHCLAGDNEWRAFEGLCSVWRGRIATTRGVVAEIQTHQAMGESGVERTAFRDRFWTMVADVFGKFEVTEYSTRLRDLDPVALRRFGPVDAGLVWLVRDRERAGQRPIVVTLDDPLRSFCDEQEVRAMNLWGIVHSPEVRHYLARSKGSTGSG